MFFHMVQVESIYASPLSLFTLSEKTKEPQKLYWGWNLDIPFQI